MNIQDLYQDSEYIKELKYKDFKKKYKKLILKDTKISNKIIMFYLPSCKYCSKIVKIWDDLSMRFNNSFDCFRFNFALFGLFFFFFRFIFGFIDTIFFSILFQSQKSLFLFSFYQLTKS